MPVCSECGIVYDEQYMYKNKLTHEIWCVYCLRNIREKRVLIIKHPYHYKPSQLETRRKNKEKRLKSSII